jgi:hypothetical protein
MRHKAFIPVVVPPVQPAGILHDTDSGIHFRFGNVSAPILTGARVRIWGGYDIEPHWLAEHDARSGVLGTVVRFLAVARSVHKEAIVRLDRPLAVGDTIGDYVVLRLRDRLAHWSGGESVTIELCELEPNTRFMRHRERGVIVETAAICELL